MYVTCPHSYSGGWENKYLDFSVFLVEAAIEEEENEWWVSCPAEEGKGAIAADEGVNASFERNKWWCWENFVLRNWLD